MDHNYGYTHPNTGNDDNRINQQDDLDYHQHSTQNAGIHPNYQYDDDDNEVENYNLSHDANISHYDPNVTYLSPTVPGGGHPMPPAPTQQVPDHYHQEANRNTQRVHQVDPHLRTSTQYNPYGTGITENHDDSYYNTAAPAPQPTVNFSQPVGVSQGNITPSTNPYNIPQPYEQSHGYEVDSEFYEDPNGHRTDSYNNLPVDDVNQTPLFDANAAPGYPEDPQAYLLKPYQQPQNHALGFHPYMNYTTHADSDDNFQPFPIAGDTYALNTYEDDEEELFSDGPFDVHGNNIGSIDRSDAGSDYSYQNNTPFGTEQPAPPEEGMQLRRTKTMKKVRLFRGNLVLDCPVSKKLLSQLAEPRSEREFTHMRYSAATCDPNEFLADQFTLRQTCYQQPRQTELFIVITMYNEDDILLGRTLQGVFKNIKHLSSRNKSNIWGKDAWKKIVVCVVSDGREKINPRARALMASLGVYQEGFAKNIVNDKPVTAHIYEYTTMVGIASVDDKNVKLTTEKTTPVQMMFCLKEKNQKKINSHRWFFSAFGPILRPNVCVLLDAGTRPGGDSIYHLWKTFDLHPNVGGACGEIKADLGKGGKHLINPLVAAQNFEYKMSNILDKPLESTFGFISVLPGAFSAYRYIALQNDVNGNGPLEKYFKGETLHDSGAGIFTSNMYLAEDRILCFELIAKKKSAWVLKYVKSAHAKTDVPDRLGELILQRRRWLNGSFFAAIYSLTHTFNIWGSSHSITRKLMFHIEFLYQALTMLFSWFAIGNFFLVFRILTNSLSDDSLGFSPGGILSTVFLWLYCASLVTTFVLSFGNRPKGTEIFYVIVCCFFAVLMAYLIFAAIFVSVKAVETAICQNGNVMTAKLFFQNPTFRDLVVSLVSTYALYFIASFMYFEPWHMFTSFIQYLLVSPSFINVLNVYAFCNIHDISWGTKGDVAQKLDLGVAKADQAGKLEVDIPTQETDIDKSYMSQLIELNVPLAKEESKPSKSDVDQDYYALVRSSTVLLWMFTNFVLIAVVLNTAGLNAFEGGTSTAIKRATDSGLEFIVKRAECAVSSQITNMRTQIYLTVILWAVAVLALFRFIGCTWYLILRLFGH